MSISVQRTHCVIFKDPEKYVAPLIYINSDQHPFLKQSQNRIENALMSLKLNSDNVQLSSVELSVPQTIAVNNITN